MARPPLDAPPPPPPEPRPPASAPEPGPTWLPDRLRWIGRPIEYLRGRRDFVLLLAVAVLAAGAFTFAEIAEVATQDQAHSFDERVLLAFRTPGDLEDPIGGPAIEEAVRDLTALGGVLLTTLFSLLAVVYFLLDHRPRAAVFLVGVIVGGVAVTFALKSGFSRPRPELVPHAMAALSASFPSGHSATSAVVYLTLGALVARVLPRRRLQIFVVAVAVVVTVGVGLSRLYLGVHWPTDVLAGWTVGAAWAVAAWLLERYLRKRGWIERGSRLVRAERRYAGQPAPPAPAEAGVTPR